MLGPTIVPTSSSRDKGIDLQLDPGGPQLPQAIVPEGEKSQLRKRKELVIDW